MVRTSDIDGRSNKFETEPTDWGQATRVTVAV